MKKDEARLTVRINSETARKLAYIADYNGRSVNRQIDWMVKREIAAFERVNGKIELENEENS